MKPTDSFTIAHMKRSSWYKVSVSQQSNIPKKLSLPKNSFVADSKTKKATWNLVPVQPLPQGPVHFWVPHPKGKE